MKPSAISKALTKGTSEDLKRRRKIIALSALGLADFTIISLYQTGVIKKLPDLPFEVFDSNKVNASPDAYKMGVPDGPLSAMVYATAITLAAAGGDEQTGRKPVFDLLLGGTVFANAAGAAYYLFNMIFKQKKACVYCIGGAIINFASAVIIAPAFFNSGKKLLKK